MGRFFGVNAQWIINSPHHVVTTNIHGERPGPSLLVDNGTSASESSDTEIEGGESGDPARSIYGFESSSSSQTVPVV